MGSLEGEIVVVTWAENIMYKIFHIYSNVFHTLFSTFQEYKCFPFQVIAAMEVYGKYIGPQPVAKTL